jgi:hypothetical protein
MNLLTALCNPCLEASRLPYVKQCLATGCLIGAGRLTDFQEDIECNNVSWQTDQPKGQGCLLDIRMRNAHTNFQSEIAILPLRPGAVGKLGVCAVKSGGIYDGCPGRGIMSASGI